MTPAIELAKKLNIDYQLHDYSHDSQATSYGLEAAEKLGVAAEQVYKTLVVQTETNKLAVAIVPVNSTVNLKRWLKLSAAKKYKWLILSKSSAVLVMCLVGSAHSVKKASSNRYRTLSTTTANHLCQCWSSGFRARINRTAVSGDFRCALCRHCRYYR